MASDFAGNDGSFTQYQPPTALKDSNGDIAPVSWSSQRDTDGNVEYKVKFLIYVDSSDGPQQALACLDLPRPGEWWQFGNDLNQWATCRQNATVTPRQTGEPNTQFFVEMTFSTKDDADRCKDEAITDPLLVPDRVSGSFVRYNLQAVYDRFGNPLCNSAWEQLKGPDVEFDQNRPQIKIEQNVADLQLSLLCQMVDTVNEFPLWGLPPRTIKLSNAPWSRKFKGQCQVYYVRTLEFDVRFDGFDRNIVDQGTKVLHGHWGSVVGSGAVLSITTGTSGALTGVILTAVVASGGAGYPVSTQIDLLVAKSDGTFPATDSQRGIVTVTTNGSGVVTSVASIVGGSGYTDNPAAATKTWTQAWVLDNINGAPPNPANPQHFDRFKDRNGENTKTLLNGAGIPALSGLGTGAIYMSILAPNTGNPLTDTTHWLPVVNPTTIDEWDELGEYKLGELVWYNVFQSGPAEDVYIAIVDDPQNVPTDPSEWTYLASSPSALVNGGNYSAAGSYTVGTYVRDLTATAPGRLHIELYNSSDFLLLGVPTDF